MTKTQQQKRTVEYTEHDRQMRITAEYGFTKFNGQDPYFSITCSIDERHGNRWEEAGGGAAHEEIIRRFPELEPLVRWHLTAWPGGPMHYLANGRFWWDRHLAHTPPDYPHNPSALSCFKSTIVFGALPGETDELLRDFALSRPRADFHDWLMGRLPALMEAFRRTMAEFKLSCSVVERQEEAR